MIIIVLDCQSQFPRLSKRNFKALLLLQLFNLKQNLVTIHVCSCNYVGRVRDKRLVLIVYLPPVSLGDMLYHPLSGNIKAVWYKHPLTS